MLKAVIFDMDGVIIDSEPQHARAALRVLKRYNLDVDLDYCRSFIGSSTKYMSQFTIDKFHLEVSTEHLLKEMNDEKDVMLEEEGYIPLPGVQNLIKMLYEKGYELAIASSSSIEEIQAVVDALALRPYLSHLVSSSHVKNPKPAPDVFLLALDKLQVKPEEAIVIEDSGFGVTAANAAGIAAIGFFNPGSGNQDLSGADLLIESFENLDSLVFENVLHRKLLEPLTIAQTKHLTVKELSHNDVSKAVAIYSQPCVRAQITSGAKTIQEEEEKLHAYIDEVYAFYGYGLWGIYKNNQLIGCCGFENQKIENQDRIVISYLVDQAYQGHGFAFEAGEAAIEYAKNELDITAIFAVIEENNAASIATIKKLGFKQEHALKYHNKNCYLFSL